MLAKNPFALLPWISSSGAQSLCASLTFSQVVFGCVLVRTASKPTHEHQLPDPACDHWAY